MTLRVLAPYKNPALDLTLFAGDLVHDLNPEVQELLLRDSPGSFEVVGRPPVVDQTTQQIDRQAEAEKKLPAAIAAHREASERLAALGQQVEDALIALAAASFAWRQAEREERQRAGELWDRLHAAGHAPSPLSSDDPAIQMARGAYPRHRRVFAAGWQPKVPAWVLTLAFRLEDRPTERWLADIIRGVDSVAIARRVLAAIDRLVSSNPKAKRG